MTAAVLASSASVAAWLYLLFLRGSFWRCTERSEVLGRNLADRFADGRWPNVVAIVPARDEGSVIACSVTSLLQQNYPGRLTVVLVDDQSTDDTAAAARSAARRLGADARLTIVRGSDPPALWTGKLWAMAQGLACLESRAEEPEFVLFTDADIGYAAHIVKLLVMAACERRAVLLSLMVKLHCRSIAERMLVPAFIFFFQKLYPFPWVNDASSRVAAAAGGCMLVRPEALRRAGGLEAIRSALIDDCALGALMKRQGPIWLGLTRDAHSLRAAPTFADVRRMVARSAYAQLGYSPLVLAVTLLAMAIVYVAPPVMTLLAGGAARALGLAAWVMMAYAYVPTIRLYGTATAWALALPGTACLYMLFTLDSAVQHWLGRGGAWKGRFQAAASRSRPKS